jgi:hypothetical protein
MIAWKDSPYAVVIMVNSDNGSIMQEILLSIAAEYDLPGISPNRRKVQAITEEERQIYAGIYRIPELGEVVISVSKNGLEINAEFSEELEYILPENDSTFFSTDDGGLFNFRIEAGKVKSLRVQNFVGIKLD